MSIPLSQLDTWSRQGAITTSSDTYTSIKTALSRQASPLAAMISSGIVKVDLQGSYAHDTNVYGDSDVDVIVRYGNTFHSNKDQLPADQYALHEQHYSTAAYQWADLRRDVIAALNSYYGAANVDTTGKKSLKVLPASGRLRLDVVPATEYRKYGYFYSPSSHSREDGIAFYNNATNALIVNYPDQHYANAVAKHGATGDRYKGLVRTFKNMRSYLVDRGHLTKEEAPSYFIQGMVYNVPDGLFVADRSNTTLEALRWLRRANLNALESQNGQHMLLGAGAEFWDPASAQKTVEKLCFLWDNWGRV